jgi:hypothetical protein
MAADTHVNNEPRWDTEALKRDFKVIQFMAPLVLVVRKSDGKEGTLRFNHHPRVYWDFEETGR